MCTAVLGTVLVVVGLLFGGVGVGHTHDDLQPPRVYMESWTDEDGMYLWWWPVEGADNYRIECVQTGYHTDSGYEFDIGQTYFHHNAARWFQRGIEAMCRVRAQEGFSRESAWTDWLRFIPGQQPLSPVPRGTRLGGGSEPEPPVGRNLTSVVLLNLSPWQAWVHLYCGYGASDAGCTIFFRCNGMEGEPVTWDVAVPRETGFSYWPGRTADDGSSADLQAALMDAGKTEAEARRRTTCTVYSTHPIAVRGYTRFGGDPALIPVAVYE